MMSEKPDLPETAKRSNVRLRLAAIAILVLAGAVFIVRGRGIDDVALGQALTGTWSAVDPSDASLHRRQLPVAHERLVIGVDGTLTHIVELESKPGNPENDLWGWKVSKGRLYVRFRGDDASGQWLPGIAFSVSDKALSMRIKGHPPKKWVRR